VQSDWVNSHVAVRLPAVVVSVEHRLLDPVTPLAAAVDDGWDVLRHVSRHPGAFGIDPARVAVFGESCGALITALLAIRARDEGCDIKAQVLVNPAVDVTHAMFDDDSVARHARTPTLGVEQLRLLQRLAIPPHTDPRPLSPIHSPSLRRLAPALVIVPTGDPLADQAHRYAARLWAADTSTTLSEHPGAGHAFLSMPGIAPQAATARDEIIDFLRPLLDS
jgi:acetyl esterase